jgi:hypothetical protein
VFLDGVDGVVQLFGCLLLCFDGKLRCFYFFLFYQLSCFVLNGARRLCQVFPVP